MPVALDLAPLIAMAVITAAILFLAIYKATVGQLIVAAIALLEKATVSVFHVSFNPFDPLIAPLKALDNYAYAALGALIETDKAIWAKFVHWNALAWQEVSGAIADVAHDGGSALKALRRVTIPLLIGSATLPLIRQLAGLESRVTALEHVPAQVVTHVEKVIEAKATIVKPTTIERVTKVIVAKAVALPQAIANPWPRIKEVAHEGDVTLARLKKIGGILTPAGILGLVLAAVGKLGFDWIRCSNMRRYGPRLCGVSPNILEDLLLGLTAVFGTLSLVSLAEQMQALVGDLGTEIAHFWRVDVTKASAQRKLGQTGL